MLVVVRGAIVILVHGLQPSGVIVRMGHHVDDHFLVLVLPGALFGQLDLAPVLKNLLLLF